MASTSKKIFIHLRKWTFQFLRWLTMLMFAFLVFFVLLFFAIQFDSVQNFLLPHITRFVTQKLKTKVEIESISIALMDKIVLYNVKLYDKNDAVMITADEVYVGVISLDFYEMIFPISYKNVIGARMIELNHASLNLYDMNGKVNIEEVFGDDDNDTTPSRRDLFIDFPNIYINDFDFWFVDSCATDSQRIKSSGHLKYNNLHLTDTQLKGGFYFHKRDQMVIHIDHLNTTEADIQLKVDTLAGTIKVKFPNPNYPDTIPYFSFQNMLLKVRDSRLDFDAVIWNDVFPTLFKPINPKDYRLNFRPSWVTFETISYFPPSDLPLKGRCDINGKVFMNLKTIKGNDLKLSYNQRSFLNANIRIDNYTDGEAIFIKTNIRDSEIYAEDIDSLLATVELPKQIANIGVVNIDGKFIGFPHDFVADAHFHGPIGDVVTDINMKFGDEIFYRGSLKTDAFHLDKFIGWKDTIAPAVNFNGFVEGKNFDLQTIDTKADFVIHHSTLFKDQVDTLKGNIIFRNQILKGDLLLDDRQGKAKVSTLINFSGKKEYTIAGDIENLDLKHYSLTEKSILVSSVLDLKMKGDSLEDMQGFCHLFRTNLWNVEEKKGIEVEDAELLIDKPNPFRKNLQFQSNLANFQLTTNLDYSDIPKATAQFIHEFSIYFLANPDTIQQYYHLKKQFFFHKSFDLTAEVQNLDPLFFFLNQKISIAKGSKLSLKSDFEQTQRLSLACQADSFQVKNLKFFSLKTNAEVAKNQYADDWKANMTLNLDSLTSGGFKMTDLEAKPTIDGKTFGIVAKAEQKEMGNIFQITALGKVDTFSIIHVDSGLSYIKLGDTRWRFNQRNLITFTDKFLKIDDFQLHYLDEFIALSGEISDQKDRITIRVNDVKLQTIHRVYPIHKDLTGEIDAKIQIQKPFSEPLANINGQIDKLQFSKVDYGRLSVVSSWSEMTNALALNVNLIQTNDTVIGLGGLYNPMNVVSPLQFHLTTHNLNLQLVQPFIKDYVYDMKGSIYLDDLQIHGDIDRPEVFGLARFSKTSLGIKYFKTKFSISEQGTIQFNQSNLTLSNVEVLDSKGRKASVNGFLNYAKIRDLHYKFLFSNLNNFLVMNTQKSDNELFYGKAIVRKGWFEIVGNTDITTINADVSTGEGTAVNIPINYYVKGSRLDYVHFKGKKDERIFSKVKIKGIKLNMNVEATPDAEMNIIFDEKAGDIIHGNGYGNLILNITPDGEFSMLGKYTIQKGDYLFTTQNIITKKFLLEDGGTISWTGDPYDATIDIKAVYKVNASLSSLDTTLRNSNRVQVQVLMFLKGSLLNPEITLSLLMPTLTQNDAVTVIQQFRNIENDPQELNRQVFSLLMFGRFAPPNAFFGNGSGSGVTSSLSELLSNQLNSWLGQSLKEDFGVSLSSNRFDDVTLLVRAKLFNNRVTVSRDGAIMNTASRDLTVGNISVHIKLLPPNNKEGLKENPGRLTIEIFNREFLGFSNTLISTNRGVGIFFKKDFDKLIELLQTKKSVPAKK